MPNWLLPLLALLFLGVFFYFGFWKGLSTKPDPNNRDDKSNWLVPPNVPPGS